MKYTLIEKLDKTQVSQLIKEARCAVLSRDIKAFKNLFSDIWSDFDQEPDFSEFEESQAIDLYRWSGSFLNFYGKAKNLPFYQERAKNLLTRAIEFYEKNNLVDEKAEANVSLAGCYFMEGAINESEAILEQTKLEFENDQLNPIYLLVCVNRMIAMISKRQYQKVFEIADEISVAIEFCPEPAWAALYFEKVGLAAKNTGQHEKAILHYHKGIELETQINNLFAICSYFNNLANLYSQMGNFELAHQYLNRALTLAHEKEFIGYIPHFLDSKSVMFSKEGHFELALETIDQAIEIFRKGEATEGLTEALWNKCKFLLALDRKEEAITLFGELIPIASRQMGEYAVKIFVKEFSDLIYIKQNGSLDEEVQRFKRIEIVNAIREAKYNLIEAADMLKITPASLNKTIDKEFPELYRELDILRNSNIGENLTESNQNISTPRNISELLLNDTEFVFENETPQNVQTFYFSTSKMFDAFGIEKDGVVAIEPLTKINSDEFVLVEDVEKNIYTFGKVNYDNILDLYFFVSEDEPIPITFEDVRLIGKAVGFCPFEEIDNDKVVFRSLQTA